MLIRSTVLLGLMFLLHQQVNALPTETATESYDNLLLGDDKEVDRVVLAEKIKQNSASMHFSEKTTIGQVVNYPLFKSFSHLLFPTVTPSDLDYRLDELYKIMPLHHNVNSYETVECVEYLADTVDWGIQAFYPIYQDDSTKSLEQQKDIGLFFFRGKFDAPYAIVVPGGFDYSTLMHDGFPLALEISKNGYNAFVLSKIDKDILKSSEYLADAVNYVQNHADKLHVSKRKYSLWGSSVGAQVVINLVHHDDKGVLLGRLKLRPSMSVLLYPISYYANYKDVPTVIVVGGKDKIVNHSVLSSAIANLKENNIANMHINLPSLEHGFGLGSDSNAKDGVTWVKKVIKFWETRTSNSDSL